MDLPALLPQPILPAHPEWVELYWKSWELAVTNIRHGTPHSGFAEAYLDDAFSTAVHTEGAAGENRNELLCTGWQPPLRIAGGEGTFVGEQPLSEQSSKLGLLVDSQEIHS